MSRSGWHEWPVQGQRRAPLFVGVVPFSFAQDGTALLLLGREEFGREAGKWSGFAGRPEAVDASIEEAAAREAAEESCGLLGTREELKELLEHVALPVHVRSGVHFLLPIPYSEFIRVSFNGVRTLLRAATSTTYAPSLEKNAVAWFSRDFIQAHPECLRAGMRADIDILFRVAVTGITTT